VFRSSSWLPRTGTHLLRRKSLLKVVSWNIDFPSPGPVERVTAILQYLESGFGNNPGQLVILLQEVCPSSVETILQNEWVRQNFAVVGQDPPRTLQAGIPRLARYFTMAMIPKFLRAKGAFRLPLPSEMGRDALFVDLMLQPTVESKGAETVFRLCTTHLESLGPGTFLRARQLKLIAKKLRDDTQTVKVTAGLVGGDMNALHPDESTMHREMGLRDAWEDGSSSDITSSGNTPRACISGHTWGYQSHNNQREPKRLDKFFYTGDLKTLPLSEAPKKSDMVELLGVGLKANVPLSIFPDDPTLPTDAGDSKSVWASDHFGIVVGVEIGG
jgi:tyrosyl-DNA phosphodiesterase 2